MLKFRIEEAMNGFVLHVTRGDVYKGKFIYEHLESVFDVIREECDNDDTHD